jgi:hypothetical protein
MKFEDVLIMETWVVEVPQARALVKRAQGILGIEPAKLFSLSS